MTANIRMTKTASQDQKYESIQTNQKQKVIGSSKKCNKIYKLQINYLLSALLPIHRHKNKWTDRYWSTQIHVTLAVVTAAQEIKKTKIEFIFKSQIVKQADGRTDRQHFNWFAELRARKNERLQFSLLKTTNSTSSRNRKKRGLK